MALRTGVIVYVVLAAAAAVLFTVAPHLDIWTSGLFYRDGFYLGSNPILHFLFRLVLIVSNVMSILLPLALLVVIWRKRPILGFDRRALIFLILALAVGPGIVVNTVLKDHWGRARPVQVTQFGGTKHFTPALEPTDQCPRNCSFPAGHPAIGFYFVSFAFLISAAGARRRAFWGAVVVGALIGLMRIVQGGHFLSDVVFSGFIIIGISWLLYQLVVASGITMTSMRDRILYSGITCTIAILLCIVFYDRKVAMAAHKLGPRTVAIAGSVTNFGQSQGYLIGSAVLFAALILAAWRIRNTALAERLRRNAWRAAFIFITVTVSGLGVDLLKVIFGRARPKILFETGFYGFFHGRIYGYPWHGSRADFWSFPSGHAATASALAMSFTLIWPRWWPAWWLAAVLVMASRIGVGAHYPSDLIGGFYIAALTVWGASSWFEKKGLALRDSP